MRGSNRIQVAYRFSRRADLSLPTRLYTCSSYNHIRCLFDEIYLFRNVFPLGLPDQFSIVCSFRKRPSKHEPWSLLRVSDIEGRPQFGITFVPRKRRLDFYMLDYQNQLQTLRFPNVNCDDGQWHKIHLGVFQDRVTFYLDCQRHSMLPVEIRFDLLLFKVNHFCLLIEIQ